MTKATDVGAPRNVSRGVAMVHDETRSRGLLDTPFTLDECWHEMVCEERQVRLLSNVRK